jgi:hypothetical protein
MIRQNPAEGRTLLQLKSRELIVSETPKQTQYSEARSPQSLDQLNLLALLEKPQLAALLKIELVPPQLSVDTAERFIVIHQESGLSIPGQFTKSEAEAILSATENWDWSLGKDRIPVCSHYLLALLEEICSPKKAVGVKT